MSDCVLWKGAVNSSGYPVTWFNGKIAYAHRVVIGASKGEVVMHTCDNPKCVNPKHLKVGTHAENSADMVSKGRQAKGEQCAASKFSKDTIASVRNLKGVMSSRKVGKLFGMSKTNVLDVWNNKIWKE